MANPFVHVELNTPDLARAKSFYASLFGWSLRDENMGDGFTYTMIDVGGGTGGGMMTMPGGPTAWLAYVLVDAIDAATEKARSLGAQVIREPMEVKGAGQETALGCFSVIVDPTGAMLGLWQEGARK